MFRSALLLFPLAILLAFANAASAGTCNGGPYNGQFCRYHYECKKWCNGGPYNQRLCNTNSECGKSCVAGVNAGRLCNFDSDCPGSGCQQWPCFAFYCLGGTPPSSAVAECSDPLTDLFASLEATP